MQGLLSFFILTNLSKSMYGQFLYDSLEEQQKCVNVTTHIINNELRQLTKSMEKMVKQNMEGIKNLDASVRDMKTDLQKLVVLQKEANDNSTNIIGDKLTCGGSLTPSSGTDCADILKKYPDTRGKDGVDNIVDLSRTKSVYCDMTTDDGGNDLLHRLTSLKPQELRVNMERFNGEKAYAVYSNISVGDETSKYKLEVNGYSGNAGDSLAYHNNMKFSTRDQENDRSRVNCGTMYRSAWWFYKCFEANPNGQYTDSEITDWEYIVWYQWKKSSISLKSIQLMIRPRF